MRRPTIPLAALALAALGPAFAQGPPPASAQETPAVRPSAADEKQAFFALQDEFDEAYEAYRVRLSELAHLRRENPDATIEFPPLPHPAFYARFLALADEGSLDAEVWVVQNYAHSALHGDEARHDKRQRMLRLLASGPTNEQLALLSRVAAMDAGGRGALSKAEALAFLDLITAAATDPEVQAGAALSKASALGGRSGTLAERKPAIDALEAIAARWPATDSGRRARGQAFSLGHLNIGQTAPEIVGQDVDGNPLKLSDFAGRVVVLDFWGFW
jgi:hypothetical protein